MGKLDDKNILRNARISEEQAKQFAYEITAEMINSYVNEQWRILQRNTKIHCNIKRNRNEKICKQYNKKNTRK